MPNSVYIHIPYCKLKCNYCSFVSKNIETSNETEEYVASLIKEIGRFYRGETLKTIYFGGGTPSLLTPKQVETILQQFIFIPGFCEITFETNPDDADANYLRSLNSIGVNRLSLGSQTFNDNILSIIGRRHNSEQIINAVESAKKAGFSNISLDLIYGLPNQTKEILKNDLEKITELGIPHVSTYGLKIEEPSYFSKNPPENLPDQDRQADMYLIISKYLEENGYKHYEISNFAKPGFESKHNLNYWNNKEYYGFGAAAHGYQCGIRYANKADICDYVIYPVKRESEHYVTPKEKFEEEIFLGFRCEKGINTKHIHDKYFINFEEKYKNVLDKYMPKYIEETENGYKLTLKGVLISNEILSEFIED